MIICYIEKVAIAKVSAVKLPGFLSNKSLWLYHFFILCQNY